MRREPGGREVGRDKEGEKMMMDDTWGVTEK